MRPSVMSDSLRKLERVTDEASIEAKKTFSGSKDLYLVVFGGLMVGWVYLVEMSQNRDPASLALCHSSQIVRGGAILTSRSHWSSNG